ncbi:sugar ABC transporter ATP-binding protein [Fundicoccus culcitae]|uniref:Autoinducer 2 import ATP-binding protein LsrA n=1 Tax=Fundicoccus culcitae TaxID=2969821 RepID=A0ABY5P538_9LACT|nr:sugar ABC transporter ATP-binding protein [Fundicoccus culcitae]UUX33543.1 sugar ABC transporter ATP-binding protein [Fundicoccus culcitae]
MSTTSLVECREICKSFSGVEVLKGVNLSLDKGDVLAIIGGNGAGKSTLMKIIMGMYSKDKGELIIEGNTVDVMNPSKALKNGIYLVPQEPLLFPNMTVEENIFIGLPGNKGENLQFLKNTLDFLDWDIDLDRQAMTLSIAEQQLVEILKGLVRKSKVLILDEPTSSLTYNEVSSLFKLINKLREDGIGIVYITHRLTEVFEIANKIVILRDGRVTLEGSVSEFTEADLIKGLLPENVEISKYSASYDQNFEDSEVVFEVKNISGNGFKDISFNIRSGEILGLAGVVGAGRTEVAESIFGRDKIKEGNVLLQNIDITGKSTSEVIDLGLNYVPEDRFRNGIFKIRSIGENITASSLEAMKGIFVDRDVENNNYKYFKEKFNIVSRDIDQEIGNLSGGNQQKIVISKTVASMPRVLILDEPTRGVDAGAREDVYKIITQLKDTGVGILVISSDMEEIVQLSDRVITMYRGRINSEFVGRNVTIDNLTPAIFGIPKIEVSNEKNN